jgi:crotonobetainyl-CoA:carnitine CoA-transferase CaiB-like acyl-CoA transferase
LQQHIGYEFLLGKNMTNTANINKGALQGIRVLDLSRILAGPWSTQIFADMGADVIKVERPGVGDDTRHWGPPFLKDKDGNDTKEASYYLSANRGKRSITIDITTAAGQQLIRELVAHCDVLVENFKVGGLAAYGLDYASLKLINEKLVYCSITGFGQDGPYAHKPGYDFIAQGMGGLMSITGEADDKPGGGPQKVGVAFADLMTGMYATVGVLGALFSAQNTGKGQQVDIALLDVQVATMANQIHSYLITGKALPRYGNAHASIVPYQVFATCNSHIILAVGNDRQFKQFCDVAEHPELAADPRYSTNPQRLLHRDELCQKLADIIAHKSKDFWITTLEAAGVPCGPIDDVAEVCENPQILSRGLIRDLQHPTAGTVPTVGNPLKLSGTPLHMEQGPPLLGQHTQDILRELLNYNEEELAAAIEGPCRNS